MASPKTDGETTSKFVRSQSDPVQRQTSALAQKKDKNWIRKTFKKRECCYFVPAKQEDSDGERAMCMCGRIQKAHRVIYAIGDYGEEWEPATHTIKSKTDAYGELEFQGAWTTTRAKYIRVSSDARAGDLLRLLTKEWGMECPKLLIEVTGGAKNFVMQPKLRRIFRHGITKAATTTNAWVLTGGTNTGVMKYVGEALHEHNLRSQNRIVAIGIATWGIVHNRQEMTKKGQMVSYRMCGSSTETKGASLDPNHTHLILVDDGTEGHYGADIPVRAQLLKLMAQSNDFAGEFNDMFVDRAIPAVCVVLGGGLGTIKVVLKNICGEPVIPCVVVNGSGMGADLMAFAYHNTDQNREMSEDHQIELKHKIAEAFPNNKDRHAKVLRDLLRIGRKKRRITVYSADDEGDIDHAILNALHKATNLSPPRQLRLALNWNRVDVAEDIFQQTIQWEERVLYECFQISLSLNRVGFATLLMEQCVDVGAFLTIERLENLYNAQEDKICPTLATMYRAVHISPPKVGEITMKGIGKVLKHLLGHGLKPYDTKKSSQDEIDGEEHILDNESYKRQLAYNHLFLWALLTKKFEMAYTMWKRGRESIAKALIGTRLCQRMCKIAEGSYNTDAVNELTKQSRRYEQLAIDLLDKCYLEDTAYTQHLLRAELRKWNQHTCLTLGAGFQLTRFIAHPAIQVLLNDHWQGRLSQKSIKRMQRQMLSEIEENEKVASTRSLDAIEGYDPEEMIEMASSGIKQEHQVLLHHFLMTGQDEEEEMTGADLDDNDENIDDEDDVSESEAGGLEEEHRTPLWEIEFYQPPETRFAKFREALKAPVVKFWVDTVFYLTFLALFTYVVLNSRGEMTAPEWVVAVFMFSLGMEEIRQILTPDLYAMYNLPFTTKLWMWAYDFWNLVDISGLILFWLGFVLRLVVELSIVDVEQPGDYKYVVVGARIFYCLAIMVWYVRLLDIFSVSETMGPYVNMIFKMGKDALSFGLIALVFMFSYGIVRGALLHPDDQVVNALAIPYWQFYGELFLEDDGRLFCGDMDPCPDGANFIYIALTIYLLIGNVVLLNMLIAIFNNTFERVKENADEIWRYQRYRLIMVYSNRPFLPPPFILLAHLYQAATYLFRCTTGAKYIPSNAMKMQFGETTSQLLYNFEETCMEDYLRQQNIQGQYSMQGTMQRISDRVDMFATVLEEQQATEERYFKTFAKRLEDVEILAHSMMESLNAAQGSS